MSLLNILRWEWFKLRSRRVIWALLAVLVAFSSVVVFIRYAEWQFKKDRAVVDEVLFLNDAPVIEGFEVDINCNDFVAGIYPTSMPAPYTLDDIDYGATERECRKEIAGVNGKLEQLVDDFTLPGSTSNALRWSVLVSIPLVAFFTVLVVGSEYGWGTLRTTLMKGTGRTRLLAAKLALIGLAMAVTWVVVLITIIVSSLVSTAFASGIGHGEWSVGAVGDVLGDTARAWYVGLPYVALAALLSILFSTWAGGVLAAAGLSVFYFFFELFSIGRLIQLFEDVAAFRWFTRVADLDLGWNSAAWMFGEGGEPIPGFALAAAIGKVEYPGDLHAFVVQLAYLLLIGGLAFWLFARRDVAGASG